MNKYLKRFLFFSLLLTFISTVSYCSAPFDTETAQTINVRKTINGEGYILRNETTVSPQSKGAFESGVQDGTRVSRNGSLGITISGNYNEELVEQLKSVSKRIDDILYEASIGMTEEERTILYKSLSLIHQNLQNLLK